MVGVGTQRGEEKFGKMKFCRRKVKKRKGIIFIRSGNSEHLIRNQITDFATKIHLYSRSITGQRSTDHEAACSLNVFKSGAREIKQLSRTAQIIH